MTTAVTGALAPEIAFALVGVLGVGSQWLAWRLRMPAIVLMLLAGLIVGPGMGLFVPQRDIGPLSEPMISIAVAIILFEGGLTLNLHGLRDAVTGVKRLVFVGAPLGWLLSALALHYIAGLGWASSAVFGGIMIVTGPTVIAPLLRQARLARRPAVMLQWEAIVNDPIGAIAAVLAFNLVIEVLQGLTLDGSILRLILLISFAGAIGCFAGWAVVQAFRRALVPEYMKVPVLFVVVLATFVLTDLIAHESGLLAVTLMGIVIANSDLPSFVELRRFKEHATILLVSGVFIMLAASMDLSTLKLLDLRALAFIVAVILIVRPLTVLISLAFTGLPMKEQLLIGFTGPRGVVLVAVAGLFGEELAALGMPDAEKIVPLAFALVATTVVLHGFTLAPFARALGLAGGEAPGLLIAGGSRFSTSLAQACVSLQVPALITDRNFGRLRRAREAGLNTYYGDILSEGAETGVELVSYGLIFAASDNDAYNTLVATDLAPEFGRDNVYQVNRAKEFSSRHALPTTLGGRMIGDGATFRELDDLMIDGWKVKVTKLSAEFTPDHWRDMNPDAILLGHLSSGRLRLVKNEFNAKIGVDSHILALVPPAIKNATAA